MEEFGGGKSVSVQIKSQDCWGLTTSIILVNGDTQNFEKVLGASGRCNFIHEIFHSISQYIRVDIEPSHVVGLT